jgi:hypothetical protein
MKARTAYYRVPKRDLITGLQVLLDRWPFEIQSNTPGVEALIRELAEFKPSRPGTELCALKAPAMTSPWLWPSPGGGCANASLGIRPHIDDKGVYPPLLSCRACKPRFTPTAASRCKEHR